MRLINNQDPVIKASLVQQIQQRASDIVRAQEKAQVPMHEELARNAEETVVKLEQTENETIREDKEGDREKKRRRRGQKGDPESADSSEARDDNPPPPPPNPSSSGRVIDIII